MSIAGPLELNRILFHELCAQVGIIVWVPTAADIVAAAVATEMLQSKACERAATSDKSLYKSNWSK